MSTGAPMKTLGSGIAVFPAVAIMTFDSLSRHLCAAAIKRKRRVCRGKAQIKLNYMRLLKSCSLSFWSNLCKSSIALTRVSDTSFTPKGLRKLVYVAYFESDEALVFSDIGLMQCFQSAKIIKRHSILRPVSAFSPMMKCMIAHKF